MKPTTAMASALEAAGYVPPADRLVEQAHKVLDVSSPNYLTSAKKLLKEIRDDADLLWELMGDARERLAIDYLQGLNVERVARKRADDIDPTRNYAPARPSVVPRVPRAPGAPRNPDLRVPEGKNFAWKSGVAASMEADRRKSKLYTFLINGRPLAEVTAAEARGWATSRERDAQFIRMVTEGVQDSMLIGDAYTKEAWREVETKYQRAETAVRAA